MNMGYTLEKQAGGLACAQHKMHLCWESLQLTQRSCRCLSSTSCRHWLLS